MIRTCLFDMGNVLVKFSHERMCAQMGALCGRTAAEIRGLLLDAGHQWDFERGRLSEPEFHRLFVRLVGSYVEMAALRRAGCDIFEPNEPMPALLDALKARGCRLVLLSNTSVSHFEFIRERYDVLQKFDEHVVSFLVGAVKPEPAMYEAALRAIGCAPDECFYTDDVPQYVEAGRRFGLQAEVFTDPRTCLEHLARRGLPLDLSWDKFATGLQPAGAGRRTDFQSVRHSEPLERGCLRASRTD